jgi:hypothetical protein
MSTPEDVQQLAVRMCAAAGNDPHETVHAFPAPETVYTPMGNLIVVSSTMPLWRAWIGVATHALEFIKATKQSE